MSGCDARQVAKKLDTHALVSFEEWKALVLGLAAVFVHSNSLKSYDLPAACLVHWYGIVRRIDSCDWLKNFGHTGLD